MQGELLFHIKKECKRRLIEESIPRIIQCLNKLSDVEIWYRPNSNTVSVGNLVLHLCGNVRQWVFSGIFGAQDTRERHLEFETQGPLEKEFLLNKLTELSRDLNHALDNLTYEHLTQMKSVQGFDESVIGILLHVVEHFSYHTGQIVYYTKSRKDVDMAFYADLDLDVTS
ncbi:MAG: DUF1572 domain-containing protein [Bacteroidia bacterium]|nr:DUF1572 domain-containing protein [Bacteroidia bacterium]